MMCAGAMYVGVRYAGETNSYDAHGSLGGACGWGWPIYSGQSLTVRRGIATSGQTWQIGPVVLSATR